MPDNTQYQPGDGELDVPEQPMNQDFETPAAPAEGAADRAEPIDHPNLDSDVDEGEKYDAGQAQASGYNTQHTDDRDDDQQHGQRVA